MIVAFSKEVPFVALTIHEPSGKLISKDIITRTLRI
jgi:hypothetical protein